MSGGWGGVSQRCDQNHSRGTNKGVTLLYEGLLRMSAIILKGFVKKHLYIYGQIRWRESSCTGHGPEVGGRLRSRRSGRVGGSVGGAGRVGDIF